MRKFESYKSWVNEKFIEDTDPIHDLGIGFMHQIKKWIKENTHYDYNREDNFLWICAEQGKTEFVKFLIEKGYDIHKFNDHALAVASRTGRFDIVKVLLDAGADPFAENGFPLALANIHGHTSVAELLEKYMRKETKQDNIKESLNEKFIEDSDPIKDMNIGKKNQILSDLKKMGLTENEIIFHDDLSFFMTDKVKRNYSLSDFSNLQIKYFPKAKAKLLNRLNNTNDDIKDIIKDAYNERISKEDILFIIDYVFSHMNYNHHRYHIRHEDLQQAKIYIQKLGRTKEQVEEDKEYNIYIFIGFMDKVPVKVGNKTYYEDVFNTETLVKIDKYNVSDLLQVPMMKLRARTQYSGNSESGVYMVKIPKDLMDEHTYRSIPEEYYDIVVKYKQRI